MWSRLFVLLTLAVGGVLGTGGFSGSESSASSSGAASSVCTQFNKCGYCLAGPGAGVCGWCSSTHIYSGPTSGTCPLSDWAYQAGSCSTTGERGCTGFPDCYACTHNPIHGNCGWCSSSGKCEDGTGTGPSSGSCSGTWHWDGDGCTQGTPVPDAACVSYTTCDTCTANRAGASGRCGWCDGTSSCLPGDKDGAFSTDCGSAIGWSWLQSSCPTPAPPTPVPPPVPNGDCSNYDTCNGCTSQAPSGNCGWCSNLNTCFIGGDSGPSNGQCGGNDWSWDESQCPSHCVKYNGNCRACTHEATPSNCGFCVSTGECHEGNSDAPNRGTCDSWHYYGNNCPVTPAPTLPDEGCHLLTKCSSCTSAPSGHCGFCVASGKCEQGGFNGPTLGSCSGVWNWYSSQCSSNH